MSRSSHAQSRSNANHQWQLLLDVVRPDAARWVRLGLLVALGAVLNLVGPIIVGRIVDRSIAGASAGEIRQLAVGFLVVTVLVQGIWLWATRLSLVAAWKTTNRLRLDLTDHVLSLDHEFHRSHTPGELIQRVDGDVTAVSDFLAKVVPRIIGSVVVSAGTLLVLSIVDWRLGLGLFVYVSGAVVLLVRLRARAVGESVDEMSLTAKLYGGIEERLAASEDLRANGAADYAMHRFVEDSRGVLLGSVRREKAFIGMWVKVQALVGGGGVVALIVSGVLISGGTLSLGTAFLLFQYVQLMSKPLEDVIDQLEVVQKATGALVRVVELQSVRSGIVDAGDTQLPLGALPVSLHKVSFGYGDEQNQQPVVRGVDLNIRAGHAVGILGRTGSGKTTFSRLVLRLVEPSEGLVRIGGVALADISISSLRDRTALIPQEVELFSGTVRDNVTLFDASPTDEAVEEALRHVGLDSLVDNGIDRLLGSGGAGLSSGEAQLLAFARVWLRQPDLIILDEATARVDPETEARIDAAVASLRRGRTTLIIAHRLSTLQSVDDIVVFDQGRVVESGPRSLLAADPKSHFRVLLDLALEPTGGKR